MPTQKTWTLDRRALAGAIILCAVVALAAYACVVFPRSQGRIAPIWLANAIAVAALLRNPTGRWPLLVGFTGVGNLLANLWAGDPWLVGGGLAMCNLLEIVTCAWLIRRRSGDSFDVSHFRHLIGFVGAAAGASALSATAAATLLGVLDHGDFLRGLLVWIQADVLGLLTLTPCLLVLTRKARTPITPELWRESWTLVLLAIVAGLVFFVSPYPLLFLISAALSLPVWRMGMPGAVAGFAIIAALGATAALTGNSQLMMGDSPSRIIGLQIFLTISFLMSVPLAAARDEGEQLKGRLRRALAEARSAHTEAEQATAVKSEFLANMSHELRTPLTSIVGFTRLAAEQPELSPISRDYVERVGEASRALLCAVNDILDFSKLEAGQVSFRPEPVAFRLLTRTTLDLFTPQAAAKDIALRLEDTTPEGLTITADPDRLRQVLLNLVGNAVKFTAAGAVTLRCAYHEAGERLTIEVIDTGAGIPPDRFDRLFKRFSQVDGSLTRGHGGTGLGLAICKGIVEAMGGEIGATSTMGEGSCFSFWVPAPRTDAQSTAILAEPGEAEPVVHPGLRILVTDDHPANRELVRLFLAGIGAEITEAADGQEAVEIAQRQAFDVILMDMRMPRLDGVGALARIRGEAGPNRSSPILAFTADAESLMDDKLQALGFDGAVAKPVEPGQLIAAIARATAAAVAEPVAERVVA